MEILVDNKNILNEWGIQVLDPTPFFSFASERSNDRTWADKSGVDKNLVNIRYDTREIVIKCYIKADDEYQAFLKARDFVEYFFEKGLVVFSLRDSVKNIRETFLIERSGSLISDINIRAQNSLYYFKLGLRDVNPNAVVYNTTVSGGIAEILYTKGQNAFIFWGDGTRGEVSNSNLYEKTDYQQDGDIDIIIDIDKTQPEVLPLIAEFTANIVNGVKPQSVTFTDLSIGNVVLWSWDFGDGTTSSEQNPVHIYENEGAYTVTLQVFNDAQGDDVETKELYITIRKARLLINDSGDFLTINNTGNYLEIN